MKKFLFAILPILAVGFLAMTPANDPLPLGSPVPNPEWKMLDITGKKISLTDAMKPGGLLVIFSCNTCPYVVKNEARIREVCGYAEKQNIGVVILNSNEAYRDKDDSYTAMKEYAQEQDFKWPYLVDAQSKMADAFGAKRTPECFLFNTSKKLVYHGAIDDNPSNADAVSRKHLIMAIDEMNSGKEISVKQSRSVGCTIKRI